MNYKDEQKELFKSYLDNHVYKYWRSKEEQEYKQGLELILTSVCNTKCSYCYYKNFGKYLNDPCVSTKDNILKNAEKLFTWMNKEGMTPDSIDIFSGEPLNLPYIDDLMSMITDKFPGVEVIIPTNGTYCKSDKSLERVESLLDKWRKKSPVFLSMSVDGKYLDNDTRSMRDGRLYDDAFYDRLFRFIERHNLAVHPMVGPKGIDKWCDNLDWYVDELSKYLGCNKALALSRIYLLEVRNPDWTDSDLSYLTKFCHHLTNTAFEYYNKDKYCFVENFLLGDTGCNFYSGITSVMPRGLGCSIQQEFSVRLGDMKLVPCHRTAYNGYSACTLKIDDNYNIDYELENENTYMMIMNFNAKYATKCCDCPINTACSWSCLGCNFEVNHDFFTPVDSVCKLEFTKLYALMDSLNKIGVLDVLIDELKSRSHGYDLMDMHVRQLIAVKEKLNGIC